MADKAYEVAYWPASDAVLKDPSIVDPALDILRTKTPFPILIGVQTETPNFWMIVVWDKVETHKAFIASPDYPALGAALAPAFKTKDVTMVHALFTADPMPAFTAGVTEHAWITPKEGTSLDAVIGVIEQILATVKEKGQEVSPGGAWGRLDEKTDEVLLVLGWTSVEAHVAFVSEGGPARESVQKLREIANIGVTHAKLKLSPK